MKTTNKLTGIMLLSIIVLGRHGWRCKTLAEVFAPQKLLTILLAGMLIVSSGCAPKKSETQVQTESGGSGGAKLLESVTYSDGTTIKYEYDDKNRIVQESYKDGDIVSTVRFAYSGDDVVELSRSGHIFASLAHVETFDRNGNTITVSLSNGESGSDLSKTITLNKDGYIIRSERTTCHYEGGRLVKSTEDWGPDHEIVTADFQYDGQKSPFSNCATPKWFLQYYFMYYIGLNNNITEERNTEFGRTDYIYEYDEDGFPTKRTMESRNGTSVETYTYRRGAVPTPVENVPSPRENAASPAELSPLETLSPFLFEQNFAHNNISEISGGDFFGGEYETYKYLPNIGFSAGKRVIYNGTVSLLDYSMPNSTLAVLSKAELRLLRNAVYAKYGMIFQSNDLTQHFQQFGWYAPGSNNVEALLTEADKANIENIQLFENATPNHTVSKGDLASDEQYYPMRPVPSDCSELRINNDNTISKYQFPSNEDNWQGTYRIENGFLVVLVTKQRISDYYSTLANWQWPDGITFTVEPYYDVNHYYVSYRMPIQMVFPIGGKISYSEETGQDWGDISYRKIGAERWF